MRRLNPTLPACAAALALCACAEPAPQPPAQDAHRPAPAGQSGSPLAPAVEGQVQAKRSPGQQGEPLLAYRAFGTEPFWSVRVDGDTLVFSTPEDQAGQQMRGTHSSAADGLRYSGQHAGKAFQLDIRPGQCSDGMSDNRYTLTSTFRHGEALYEGCAEQAMAK